jgi:hypothetical protein
MADNPQELAKKALIAYRQLHEIVKETLGHETAKAHLDSYNRIVETLNECFAIDPAFADAIKHIHAFGEPLAPGVRLVFKMEADGKILLATAHSFIEMYLSPEDKKKAIGF